MPPTRTNQRHHGPSLSSLPLRPSAFLRLREKLDEVEEQQWCDSLAKITKRTRAKGVTDEQIDEMVMRRRRESSR